MKKLFFTLGLVVSGFAVAQQGNTYTEQDNQPSKWTFGGAAGVGGAIGSGNSGVTISLSPRVGYKATEDLELGLSGNFSWTDAKYYNSTMFGIGPFANYYFSRKFYVTGLFQQYFYNQKLKDIDVKGSSSESALYLGAGYMQYLGGRTYMQIGGMYNVLYNQNKSVFGGAFIPNIGIVVGI